MIILEDRILLHLQDGRRIPIDPGEIYLLEAEGGWSISVECGRSGRSPKVAGRSSSTHRSTGSCLSAVAALQLSGSVLVSRSGSAFGCAMEGVCRHATIRFGGAMTGAHPSSFPGRQRVRQYAEPRCDAAIKKTIISTSSTS